MKKVLLLTVTLMVLIAISIVSGTGCQKNYQLFEAPADSVAAPDTITAGEDLQVILYGIFSNMTWDESGEWPKVDHIEQKVSDNLIELEVIAKAPIKPAAAPVIGSWVDTIYVKNLTRATYEVKIGALMDTVVVK